MPSRRSHRHRRLAARGTVLHRHGDAAHVDVQRAVERLQVELVGVAPGRHDACIRDHDVEPAEVRDGLGDDAFDVDLDRDVGGE